LSIGYANICSSVQDHRQNLISLRGSGRTKESKRKQKGSLKLLKKSAPDVQSAPEVMTSSKVSSSEAPHQKQDHQKLKFVRS